jgi:aspartate-semialdehyde dehydrogenase
MLLLDVEDLQGQLTELEGEPTILQPVTNETFDGVDLAIFACQPAFTEQHWREAQARGARIIDLSGFLEGEPAAQLCAPLIKTPSGNQSGAAEVIAVPAHPAAVAIAGLLQRLSRRASLRHAAIVAHVPVSERGQAGVEELHQQTVTLLSFQEVRRSVFDAQVAFNTLAAYGEQTRPTLHAEQDRIARHIRTLLGKTAALPSLRLLQASVFHSYSFLCWIELEQPCPVSELETELNGPPFAISAPGEDLPNVVSASGTDLIQLGTVEPDPVNEAACWIWGTFDNLRISGLGTAHIAEAWFRNAESDRAAS